MRFRVAAIINPMAAWQLFSQSGFDASWLDGGASRTWYLALASVMFPSLVHWLGRLTDFGRTRRRFLII